MSRGLVTRRAVLALLPGAFMIPALGQAETALPRPRSLRDASIAAAARGEPLVLLVSLPGCPYCERIRRSHLLPLEHERGGVFQIDIGSAAQVVDFDGEVRTHAAVIDALNARFTPTVLFFGPHGNEIGERLVGAGIPDFYGAILEQRLDAARATLHTR